MAINDVKSIGKIIAVIRKAHGHSQSQLAEAVGLSRLTISMIEQGNDFKISYLLEILKLYEIEAASFFSEDLQRVLLKLLTKIQI